MRAGQRPPVRGTASPWSSRPPLQPGAIAADLAPALIDVLLAAARWLAGFGPPPRRFGALLGAAPDLPRADQNGIQAHVVCAIQLVLNAVSPPPMGPSGLAVEAPPGWARGPGAYDPSAAPPSAACDPHALAAALAQDLARILRSMCLGRRAPLRSLGTRPHLPAVLLREADPRASDQVSFAKPPPGRRWTAVGLLVDLSGSMRGEKEGAAKLGVEDRALTLSALGVPFALQGFQDVLIPLLPFEAHRPAAIPQATTALGREVRGDRPGATIAPRTMTTGRACMRPRRTWPSALSPNAC
jgi:hypothetical protein